MRNLSVGLCLLGGVVAQAPLYELRQPGSAVQGIGVGDLDGDGHGDIAAAAPGAEGGRGVVRLYSGSSGELLRELVGAAGESIGQELAAIGDVDRDGRSDVGIRVRTLSGATLRLISGATGSVSGNLPISARVLSPVAGGHDIDGDGASDVAGVVDTGSGAVAVVVYSGLTGTVLRSFAGTGRYGWSLAFVGDQDSDGVADLAIGSPGNVELRSLVSGALLRTLRGPVEVNFASAIDGGFDVDRDAWPDLLITAAGNGGTELGYVDVVSGRTGTVLRTLRIPGLLHFAAHKTGYFLGDATGDGLSEIGVTASAVATRSVIFSGAGGVLNSGLGGRVRPAGDVNGDRRADVVTDDPAGADLSVRVWSIAPLALTADRHQVSLAQGGAQSLTLAAEPSLAGLAYLFVGSVSGSTPGISALGHHVPLNVDAYTIFTLTSPTQGHMAAGAGVVPANGVVRVAFQVAANWPPALLGLTAHHAALVFDGNGDVRLVSNAVPISYVQ